MEPPGHKYKMTIRDIVMKDFGKVRNFVINFKHKLSNVIMSSKPQMTKTTFFLVNDRQKAF